MEELAYLLTLTEEELKQKLYNDLMNKNMSPILEDGFIYVKGTIPILLVAHMDTVFDEPPTKLYYNKSKDKIFSSYRGIGGDDRCGVYAIMKILEKYRPHVLFTEDEEKGGIGASKAVLFLERPKVKYMIELDRRGSNDCVFYDCGNYEFIKYVESFGFVTNYGTFSDISVLGSAWDIAAVNLSSGYYNEHTEKEYIKFMELQHNIKRVQSMIKAHWRAKYYDYQEIKYSDPNFSLGASWWRYMSEPNILSFYSPETNKEDSEKKLVLKKDNKTNNKKGDK